MKDPRDPGTIDGFADLLESLENEPPKEAPKMTQPQFSPELHRPGRGPDRSKH